IDPRIRFPNLKVAATLLKKRLGLRYLLDVIPLNASLVKGSHGRITDDPCRGPLFISSEKQLVREKTCVPATEVKDLILGHLSMD
ncbi:alkaline phosphatase family protein, partial [Acidobacteria bacterium AH-259-L09]|nr:alkaline phosphatase family protein [Acidobacteria bacterium AH-259-L09]